MSQLHTAVNNFCEYALYLRCWVIAYSSVCAFESLIISVNYSGYESIMSHIEECSQCVVAVAFTLTRDSLRKAEVALLHSVNLIGLQVRSEKKKTSFEPVERNDYCGAVFLLLQCSITY